MADEKKLKMDGASKELQQEVLRRRAIPYEWSYLTISEWLTDKMNFPISHVAVQKWFERTQEDVVKRLLNDDEFQSSTASMFAIVLGEFTIVTKRMFKLHKDICTEKDVSPHVKSIAACKVYKEIVAGSLAMGELVGVTGKANIQETDSKEDDAKDPMSKLLNSLDSEREEGGLPKISITTDDIKEVNNVDESEEPTSPQPSTKLTPKLLVKRQV